MKAVSRVVLTPEIRASMLLERSGVEGTNRSLVKSRIDNAEADTLYEQDKGEQYSKTIFSTVKIYLTTSISAVLFLHKSASFNRKKPSVKHFSILFVVPGA